MNLRTFITLQLLLGLLACTPPVPEPDPTLDMVTQFDTFDELGSLFTKAMNTGNTSRIDSSHFYLSATLTRNSGWVYTYETYVLAGLSVEFALTQVSNDFCFEFSPTRNIEASNGMYLNEVVVRCYIFDPQHLFHVQYSKMGARLIDTTVVGLSTKVPVKIRLRFTDKEMFYEFSQDSVWHNVYTVKEEWQGRWYFALTSVGSKGTTKVDWIKIAGPKANFEFDDDTTGTAELYWNPHPEQKVKFHPGVKGYGQATTTDTAYVFKNLPKGKELEFELSASDSVGNRSDTVKVVHKIK